MESVNVSRSNGTYSSKVNMNISVESSIVSRELDQVLSMLAEERSQEFLLETARRFCGFAESKGNFRPQFYDLEEDLEISRDSSLDDVLQENLSTESKLIDASSSQGVGDSMGDFREIDQVVN